MAEKIIIIKDICVNQEHHIQTDISPEAAVSVAPKAIFIFISFLRLVLTWKP